LLRRLWKGLGIPGLLDQLGIGKYSGLSADALLFVYALLGAANARSIQHLVALAWQGHLAAEAAAGVGGVE
jgi:hypothetical protein